MQTPLQPSKRKRESDAQAFCTSAGILAAQSDWLMWQLSHLHVLGFLTTNHLALLIAHLQFAEVQQATLKALLLAESIATASPWCEAVLYLADPPFLFG